MITLGEYGFPDDLYYEKEEHLWLRVDTSGVRMGLDALAGASLGQIVHVEIQSPDRVVSRGEQIGTLEAEKMVIPLIAPITGTVTGRNTAALGSPGLISEDPYGQGWLVVIDPTDFSGEASELVSGSDAIESWAAAEVDTYRDNGWIE